MTSAPIVSSDLIDRAGRTWTLRQPAPDLVTVALTAEQLSALAEHERSRGNAPLGDDFARVSAALTAGVVTPAVGARPAIVLDAKLGHLGIDETGALWLLADPGHQTRASYLDAGEHLYLANAYRDLARQALENDTLDAACRFAGRGLQMQEMARLIDPNLRFDPECAGSA